MAIGTLPPWVRGPNAAEAISSGGSAGLGVARIQQEQQADSERMGMEAIRMRQGAQLEQARLQQAAQQHEMEFAARQKLAEQNQLREQQRLNIENAYKTAALGIAQGRLEQTHAAAEEKAKSAAQLFQREQNFSRDVAAGVPVMEAYRRNPVSASLLSTTERTQLREDQSKPVIRQGRYPIVRIDPKTGESKVIYTPAKKQTDDVMGAAKPNLQQTPTQKPGLMRQIFGGSAPTPNTTTSPTNKDKVVRAHALGIAHPDWTKEQIIDAVNKEMP